MPNLLKNLIIIISILLLLTAGIYVLQKSAPGYLQILEPKTELKNLPLAPDFELPDLNSQKIRLSDFRGKKIILNFWASWNENSIKQLKILNDYSESHAAKETIILAINSLEEKALVEKITAGYVPELTILLDQDGATGELYDLGVLPLTVIIDKGRLVLKRIVGPLTIQEIAE